jgi:hypothetical protein
LRRVGYKHRIFVQAIESICRSLNIVGKAKRVVRTRRIKNRVFFIKQQRLRYKFKVLRKNFLRKYRVRVSRKIVRSWVG